MEAALYRCGNRSPEHDEEGERGQDRQRVTVEELAEKFEVTECDAPGALIAKAARAWHQSEKNQEAGRWHRELQRKK